MINQIQIEDQMKSVVIHIDWPIKNFYDPAVHNDWLAYCEFAEHQIDQQSTVDTGIVIKGNYISVIHAASDEWLSILQLTYPHLVFRIE